MSKVVDERVVRMQFDNAQFEQGVQTSMSTIDKLKRGLKFDGATKGMENIESAAKKVNFNPLTNAVSALGQKFSALEVVSITAISRMTNAAIDAGKKMISALTIDPIKTGFQEYETQINAVQTILANTSHAGTTLDEVNSALDQLNKYADMTIYNFTQMTKNIGTFTAAGVDLKTSVSAIKGIANLAAVSGSTSQQASTAMYQLSQAIAAGRVNLQDWNSVVNAGMGGKVFQDALRNTAKAMGVVVDETKSFRESISGSDSWLNADILLKTLEQFTGDMTDAELAAIGFTDEQIKAIQQMAITANEAATKVKTFTQLWDTLTEAAQSGWTQTWELIIGDFEQAKTLLTEISDAVSGVINESADTRNQFLSGALIGSDKKWDQIIEKVNDAGISTEQLEQRMKELAITSGGTSAKTIQYLIDKYGSLSEAIKKGWLPISLVTKAIKSFSDEVSGVTKPVQVAVTSLETFNDVVRKVIRGDFGNGAARIQALTQAGYDNVAVQKLVNMVWERNGHNWSDVTVTGEELAKVIGDLSTTELQSIGYTEEQANALKELAKQAEETGTPLNELIANFNKPSGRELIIDSFRIALTSLYKIMMTVKEAWTNIFPPMTSSQLYGIIEAFHNWAQTLAVDEKTLGEIRRTLEGVFAILDLVGTFLKGGFRLAIDVINKVLGLFGTNLLELSAKLGDAAVAFRNFVKDNQYIEAFFNWIVANVPKAVQKIIDWVNALKELPIVKTILDKLSNGLMGMRDIAQNVIAGLQNGLQEGFTSIPQILVDLGKRMIQALKDVLGIASPAKEFIKIAIYIMQGIIEGISQMIHAVVSSVAGVGKTIVSTMMDVLKNIDWGSVITIGMGIGIIVVANKLAEAIDKLAAPLEGLENIMNETATFIQAKTSQIKAGNAKVFAEALAIVAGALVAVAMVNWKDLAKAGVAMVTMMAILITLMGAVDKFGPKAEEFSVKDFVKFQTFALGLIEIAAALGLAALAMSKLTKTDWPGVFKAIVQFAAIITGLLLLLKGFKKIEELDGGGASIKNFTQLMVKLGSAILTLVGVIKLISLLKTEELGKGAIFLAGFTAFMALLQGISRINSSQFNNMPILMTSVGTSVLLLAVATKLIAKLDYKDLGKAGVFMAGFLAVMAGLQLIGMIPSKGIQSVGTTLMGVAGAVAILSLVVRLLGGLSIEAIGKGELAVLGLVLMVESMVKTIGTLGKDAPKISKTLLTMSISIGILAAISALIGTIKTENLVKGIAAVGALSLFMSGMIKATLYSYDAAKSITAMSVSIGILAASIGLLSFLDPEKLIAPTACMAALMFMFSLVLKNAGMIKESFAALIVMDVALALMATSLYFLNDLNIENMLGTATALSALMLALSVSLAIIGNARAPSGKAIGALGTMIGAVALIGLLLGALGYMNIQPSIETAESIALLIGAMTLATLALAAVGKLGGVASAANGAAALDAVIAIVGGLMVAIGGLVEWKPQLEEFLDKGLVVLEKIGQGLGSFVGGLVGGLMSGTSAGLPQIATDLSTFMENLGPFLSSSNGIDASSVDSIKSIASMIMSLTAADMLSGISKWLGGSGTPLSTFAEQLIPFGEAMAEFSDTIAGKIDTEAVEAAASAGMMLAELNKSLPREGGMLQDFLGTNIDLGTFGESLKTFGQCIVDFSDVIAPYGQSKINEEAVESAANAGKMMADLAKNLPRQGGWMQDLFGTQDLSVFGSQLTSFGEAIVEFSEVVAPNGVLGINEEAIESAANAGTLLAKLNSSLPKTGGKWQEWFGGQDLKEFSANIIVFGRCIAQFSKIIAPEGTSVINSDAVEAASNAGLLLANLNNAIPKSGGVTGWWSGNVDFAGFSENLVTFGEALAGYSDAIKDVNPLAVSSSAVSALALVDLVKSLGKENVVVGWFTDKNTLDTFFDGLISFGENLSIYSDFVRTVNPVAVSSSAIAAKDIADLIKNLGDKGLIDTKMHLSDIAGELPEFGRALAVYSDFASLIDPISVNTSIVSAKSLVELVNALGENTGVFNFSSFIDGVIPLGTSIAVYSDFVKTVDVTAVKDSVSAITDLVRMSNEYEPKGFLTDQTALTEFASGLVPLGENLAVFSEKIDGIKPKAIEDSIASAKSLIELVKALNSEEHIYNSVPLDSFGGSLESFGGQLLEYSNKVGTVNKTKVTDSAEAAQALVDLFTFDKGNLTFDKEALSAFTDNLKSFGESLESYSGKLTNIEPDLVTDTSTAIQSLVKVTKSLGSADLYGTDGTFASFGKGLETFGNSFYNFGTKVSGVVIDDVDPAITLLERLVDLSGSLAADNKLADLVSKKQSFEDFGAQIEKLGDNVRNFYNQTSQIKAETLEKIFENIKSIADMAQSLTGLDFSGFTDLTDRLSKAAVNGVDYFIKAFDGSHEKIKTAVDSFIDAAVAAVPTGEDGSATSFYTAMSSMIQNGLTAVTKKNKDASDAGKDLTKEFADGVKKNTTDAENAVKGLGDAAINKIKSTLGIGEGSTTSSVFEDIGKNIVDGIVKGITDNLNKVQNAGKTLGKEVEKATKEETKTHSPSKVFEEIGGYLVDGLAKGIGENGAAEKAARKSASEIANTVKAETDEKTFSEIGSWISQGLANGMSQKSKVAEDAARKVAQSVEEVIRDETTVHSPPPKYIEIGKDVVEGIADGGKAAIGYLKDAMTDAANNGVLNTITDRLLGGVGNLLGNDFMVDVSAGIKSNMSAEEVAKKKAENIANAFKSQLEKLDLAASIRDLEFNLFGLQNDTKSDFDAYQRELKQLQAQQSDQVQRVALAQEKYNYMVKTFGESSQNSLEAYKELLEAQIELANLEKEISQKTTDYEAEQLQKRKDIYDQKSSLSDLEYELYKTQNERYLSVGQKALDDISYMQTKQRRQQELLSEAIAEYNKILEQYGGDAQETYDAYANVLEQKIALAQIGNEIAKAMEDEMDRNTKAYEEYEKYIKENKYKLKRKGWTTEEIEAKAREESGYDPNSFFKKAEDDIQKATVNAMSTVQKTYQATAITTLEPLTGDFGKMGTKYATAVGKGIKDEGPAVVNTTKAVILDAAIVTRDEHGNWVKNGAYLGSGLAQGIRDSIPEAVSATESLSAAILNAACVELEIESPSKKFAELGMYVDLGFAKGIAEYTKDATSASSDMAVETMDAMTAVIAKISDSINSDLDVEPTITPVLDLSSVKTGMGKLNTMLNYEQALTIGSGVAKPGSSSELQNGSASGSTSVQFVQNNYSPKALSRIDIYRQTKNQLSTIERVVKGQ